MENQLINIKVENDQQLVSARELHKELESKKRFADWWKQSSKRFKEGRDYTMSPESDVVPTGNGGTRKLDGYWLTIDTAKAICMMSQTNRGDEVREYFIEVEKQWNDPVMVI